MNYYKILESTPTDSLDTIKKNYKRLVKIHHPDISKDSNSEEIIKSINSAYDWILKNHNISSPNVNPNPFHSSNYKEDVNYQGPKNKDVHVTLFVDLCDFYNNKKFNVRYQVEGNRNVSVDVTLHDGINIGDTIIFRKKGYFQNYCQPAGDVHIKIQLSDKSTYTLIENQLNLTVDVTYLDLLIGNIKGIELYDGSVINLQIPDNFKFDTKMRIAGRGIKKDKSRGDLFLNFRIKKVKLNPEIVDILVDQRDELV